jgi:hypothetical protein
VKTKGTVKKCKKLIGEGAPKLSIILGKKAVANANKTRVELGIYPLLCCFFCFFLSMIHHEVDTYWKILFYYCYLRNP